MFLRSHDAKGIKYRHELLKSASARYYNLFLYIAIGDRPISRRHNNYAYRVIIHTSLYIIMCEAM